MLHLIKVCCTVAAGKVVMLPLVKLYCNVTDDQIVLYCNAAAGKVVL